MGVEERFDGMNIASVVNDSVKTRVLRENGLGGFFNRCRFTKVARYGDGGWREGLDIRCCLVELLAGS